MAADLLFQKITQDCLVPATAEAREWMRTLKLMGFVKMPLIKERSGENHRRFFALLNIGFDHWEPQPIEYQGRVITPEKNFDEFRAWVTVLSGFYTVTGYPDGSVRIRAKSIKFSKMDESEFSQLFNAAVDVLLKHVMTNYERPDLERAILEFSR
ncbi:DUF1367 family protein [Salinispirillum sp. LH 10-3-1]|uniref:DUF1367 family protein n=1 Tax=Salinispirillum sp. LH 10-3-1 TaxID=2952525 RepID=A0AB38YC40_9GAMM